jgi:DNA polymerase V
VQISYFEDDSAGGTVPLNVPSDRFDVLLEAAKIGLRYAWRQNRSATHMHLIATELVRPGAWQRSLFEPPDDGRAETLARLKRDVNERYGRFRLRSGATLFANDFYADEANEYDVCDIHDKFCF